MSATAAGQGYKINKSALNFGTVAIGQSAILGFAVQATSAAKVTVSAYSVDTPVFKLQTGIIPASTSGHGQIWYSFAFIPTSAAAYTGTLTLTVNGAAAKLPLSGTGLATGAVATVSPAVLYFDNQPQGTTSAPETVTVTNSGTSPLKIVSVSTQAPFSTTGLKTPYSLSPGQSVTTTVSYFGGLPGSAAGSLALTYDVISPKNAALHGSTAPASSLAIISNPALQLGTAGFAYLQQLLSSGGTGNVYWSLAPGSNLPQGLSLSVSGAISGTIAASVPLQTYQFSVQATDSNAPPQTVRAKLSLTVLKPTGASCNNISWNVPGTTTPMVAIPDLGTGTYMGSEGGLYDRGSNNDPDAHHNDGVSIARGLTPLDVNGNPDPNGKMVLVGLGISTLLDEMSAFTPMANGDPEKNPALLVINGGEAQADDNDFASIDSPYWSTLLNNIIPNAGASPNQVVAMLFEDIDASPSGMYPGDDVLLQSQLETIAQNVHTLLPNVRLLFFQTRIYSGFSNGVSAVDPETYAYEYGFAIRGAIEDQINGVPSLNYNPISGPVRAPWMSWGPYTWANGMIANQNGLAYSCQDFVGPSDGHHPSQKYGAPKVAAAFLNFFKTSDVAVPWFLAPATPQ